MMKLCAVVLVASAVQAQSDAPEASLLARIKAHAIHELGRVPNYTCLETISRFRTDTNSRSRTDWVLGLRDTVRLEIVYSDRREWYGSPGRQRMDTQNPAAFVGEGMIGNGAFAGILHNVLAAAILTYRGEEMSCGRRAARFDFHLGRELKSMLITLAVSDFPQAPVRAHVGQEGSIWVDPVSLDLVGLDSHVTEIPVDLPLAESETNVRYARMRIGEFDVLLAQKAESHMRTQWGTESFNRMDFTHCRAYTAQSQIRYGQPPEESGEGVPTPSRPQEEPARWIPAFLTMRIALAAAVRDQDTVGTLIDARVTQDVWNAGVLTIPKGSAVHGRIRRMEDVGNAFIVGLEFSEVEVRGAGIPFYADFVMVDGDPRTRAEVFSERAVVPGGQEVILPDLPGVALLSVRGARGGLPRGFQMVWRTRGAIAGVDKK